MPIINTAIHLKDLPVPPPEKTGWPWTEGTECLPDLMPDGRKWPRISIVTPSYNYGQFIEETIRSVLLQGYPNLEYIIIDGGSTDNTVEIIQKYENYLTYWVSELDEGQTDAINKGYLYCTGDIFAWINADDAYTKSALQMVSKYYLMGYTFIAGSSLTIYVDGSTEIVNSVPFDFARYLKFWIYCALPQVSVFVAKKISDNCFPLDKSLYYLMDYQFFLRVLSQRPKSAYTNEIWSRFRFHGKNKTGGYNPRGMEEFYQVALAESKKLPPIRRQIFAMYVKDFVVLHPLILNRLSLTPKEIIQALKLRPTIGQWTIFWKILFQSIINLAK
jgi:glycosyltransferase involved in cell wall biosynthesis